jgi:hypothetical protein
MFRVANAVVASVRVVYDDIDERIAAKIMRKLPGLRFIDPHQRRLEREALPHTERDGDLQRFDRVVATIGITGEIGLAHAANDHTEFATISQRGSELKKKQIATRHERIRQTVFLKFDFNIARQRGVGELPEHAQINHVIVAQALRPFRKLFANRSDHLLPRFEFDAMTLTVIEAHGFHVRIPRERPREARRGILSAGEEHKCTLMIHSPATFRFARFNRAIRLFILFIESKPIISLAPIESGGA